MDIRIEEHGPIRVAHLTGEIDPREGEHALDELYPMVTSPGTLLAVDLSGLESINSTGLSSLINLVTRARLAQGRVVLVAPSPFVSSVFEVTCLNTWFEIVEDLSKVDKPSISS